MGKTIHETLPFAVVLACLLGATSCGNADAGSTEPQRSSGSALNANPSVNDFVIYAENSATLRDRVVIAGGDVGVRSVSAGPTLVAGFELALASDARVDLAQDVLANRVLLQDRARVGDVEAQNLTNQFGFFANLFPFPVMPALPSAAVVTPGSTSVSVPIGGSRVLDPASYATISVGARGTLRLSGGLYQLTSLSLEDEARIEALAPIELRIAGRLGSLSRVRIGPAAGTSLTARDLRIEISGQNGSSGSLSEAPKAVTLGNDSVVTGLILARNGTLQVGQRASVRGAFMARDVFVDNDARATFESGFNPPVCSPPDCDDADPCTADSCVAGSCSHVAVPNCAVHPHLATAVNSQPVFNPGGTTHVPLGGSVEFTVRVPNAAPGVPVEVRYYLGPNLVFQGATAGSQTGIICEATVFDSPLPNGVQGGAQALRCVLDDGTTPLVITSAAQQFEAPRDDPYAAVACFAPFASCVAVRIALDLPAGTVPTVGPQRTALVLASAVGAPPHPYGNAVNTASVFFSSSNPESANSFYALSSYGPDAQGATTLVGANGAAGSAEDVHGPYTVQTNGCMNASEVLEVVGSSIDFTGYERIVILANDPLLCGGGGLTGTVTVLAGGVPKQIPTSINYNAAFGDTTLNGRIGRIILHEYGHQLGLDHGGGWDCGATAQALDAKCADLPFLDVTDIMGAGLDADFAPLSKERLGWLEGGRALPVWSSGRFVLNAYEDGAENVKVLKLPRKLRTPGSTDPRGPASGYYYLAFRRPEPPWDQWLTTSPAFANGIAVYMDEGTLNAATALLDMTPSSSASTAADFFDGALLPGLTFTDAASGFSVTVVSVSATSATVDVLIEPRATRYVQVGASDPFGNAVPGASVLGSGSYPPGTAVTLTAVPPAGFGLSFWLSSSGLFLSPNNPFTLTLEEDTLLWAIFQAQPPANDAFANAQVVTVLPSQFTAFTQSATREPGEPDDIPCEGTNLNPQSTVWYGFTPNADQDLVIDTNGSDYGTTIAVFTGSALDALTLVPGACDFFVAGLEGPSVTLSVDAGTTYLVQIGSINLGQNLVANFASAP